MSTLESQLREQISLLADYCELYDRGKVGHALSVARGLDVIIQMLHSKEGGPWVKSRGVTFLSNARAKNANDEANGYHPLAPLLVETTVGTGYAQARFVPVLTTPESIYSKKSMKLAAWCNEIVLTSRTRRSATRRKLIEQMRNRTGGSHTYSEPEPDFKAVADKMGLGLFAFGPQGVLKYNPPAHIATMRHMAHEMSESLASHLN